MDSTTYTPYDYPLTNDHDFWLRYYEELDELGRSYIPPHALPIEELWAQQGDDADEYNRQQIIKTWKRAGRGRK